MANFHDAHIPERTTPQGYQDPNVGLIHEETDVDLGAILKWFGALTLTTVVVFLIVWGIWEWWPERQERVGSLPSPVFAMPQLPPQPHLLPDPEFNAKNPTAPQLEPKDQYEVDKRAEDATLEKYQLLNPQNGLARLPARAAASIADQGTPASGNTPAGTVPAGALSVSGLEYEMPSMPSGGTALENRLR